MCIWLHVHPSLHPFILSALHPHHPTSPLSKHRHLREEVAGAPRCKVYAITQTQVAPLKIAFIHQLMVYGRWQKGRRKVSCKNRSTCQSRRSGRRSSGLMAEEMRCVSVCVWWMGPWV